MKIDFVVCGDLDLLVLRVYMGIPILTPREPSNAGAVEQVGEASEE